MRIHKPMLRELADPAGRMTVSVVLGHQADVRRQHWTGTTGTLEEIAVFFRGLAADLTDLAAERGSRFRSCCPTHPLEPHLTKCTEETGDR